MTTKQVIHEDASTAKPKERRIVTWTQEEDDILREQISLHGTENWTIIASKFKGKTTRQCRRRWYTYLNSDFKKGGWSPEEDMLLCEAQKIYGNRWTEIAKVVSGRTDNAVKNRFSTLCKKRAKHEALVNENRKTFINANSKRVLIQNRFHPQAGTVDVASPLKKLRRAHIPNAIVNCNSVNILHKESGNTRPQLRPPFAVLAQNDCNVNDTTIKEALIDGNKRTEGTFIRKDDPKVAALIQQAELLSSLAVKVNMESTDQSLEGAWKVLQNFISKSKDSEVVKYRIEDVELQLDDLKNLMEELRSSNEGIQPPQREHDAYESPSSSEYSTGSTILSTTASNNGNQQSQAEICTMHDNIEATSQSVQVGDDDSVSMSGNKVLPCKTTDQEFNSPSQVTPIFKTLASTIPSPQFSESERHFLLRTLGIESPAPNAINNPLQPPPCRKALLQGL